LVTITCPWCEEESPLELARLAEPDASFTCAECGTTVAFVEEPVGLELAA
jgi:uncharacterized Zn finger protein